MSLVRILGLGLGVGLGLGSLGRVKCAPDIPKVEDFNGGSGMELT